MLKVKHYFSKVDLESWAKYLREPYNVNSILFYLIITIFLLPSVTSNWNTVNFQPDSFGYFLVPGQRPPGLLVFLNFFGSNQEIKNGLDFIISNDLVGQIIDASSIPELHVFLMGVRFQKILFLIGTLFLCKSIKQHTNMVFASISTLVLVYAINFPTISISIKILFNQIPKDGFYLLVFLSLIPIYFLIKAFTIKRVFLLAFLTYLLIKYFVLILNNNFIAPESPPLNNYLSSALSEGLSISFFLIFLSCIIAYYDKPNLSSIILASLSLSFLFLIREQYIFLIFVITIISGKFFIKNRGSKFSSKLALLSLGVVIFPICVFLLSPLLSYKLQNVSPKNGVSSPQRSYTLLTMAIDVASRKDLDLFNEQAEKEFWEEVILMRDEYVKDEISDEQFYISKYRGIWLNQIAPTAFNNMQEELSLNLDRTDFYTSVSLPIIKKHWIQIIKESSNPFRSILGLGYDPVNRIIWNERSWIILIIGISITQIIRNDFLKNSPILILILTFTLNAVLIAFFDIPNNRNTWFYEICLSLAILFSIFRLYNLLKSNPVDSRKYY